MVKVIYNDVVQAIANKKYKALTTELARLEEQKKEVVSLINTSLNDTIRKRFTQEIEKIGGLDNHKLELETNENQDSKFIKYNINQVEKYQKDGITYVKLKKENWSYPSIQDWTFVLTKTEELLPHVKREDKVVIEASKIQVQHSKEAMSRVNKHNREVVNFIKKWQNTPINQDDIIREVRMKFEEDMMKSVDAAIKEKINQTFSTDFV